MENINMPDTTVLYILIEWTLNGEFVYVFVNLRISNVFIFVFYERFDTIFAFIRRFEERFVCKS